MSFLNGESLLDRINSDNPDKHLVVAVIASVLERRHDALEEIFLSAEEHGLEQGATHLVVLEVALRLSAFYESLPRHIVIAIVQIATETDAAAVEFAGFLARIPIHETSEGVRLNIGDIDRRWWPRDVWLNS